MFFDWLGDMIVLVILAPLLVIAMGIWAGLKWVVDKVRDFLGRLFGNPRE